MEIYSMLLASLTDAVFGWVVEAVGKREQAENLQRILSGDPAKLAYQRSLAVAYAALSRNYPEWTESFFDEHFILHNNQVAHELSKTLSWDESSNAEFLASLWEKQFHIPPSGERYRLVEAINHFLSILTIECKAQEALQPVFDRRALERLHDIAEVGLKQAELLEDIQSLILQSNKHLRAIVPPPIQPDLAEEFAYRIPARPQFIGRHKELSNILDYLRPGARSWLVVIEGSGGTGKSALALEAAHLCADQKFFDLIVWMTAQERYLQDDSTEDVKPEFLTLEDVLEIIGRVAKFSISDLPLDAKRKAIDGLLSSKRCLLIIDNFETVKDEGIRKFLRFHIPAPSKAVITSRLQISSGELISLRGLLRSEIKPFIQSIVNSRRLKDTLQIETDLLKKIWEWSGGIPLAIKWLVGQSGQSTSGLRNLIENLPDLADEELLEFCFRGLYEQLTSADKVVLQSFTIFRSPVSKETIAATSDLRGLVLEDALETLWRKYLIEFDETSDRYSTLPLTRRYARWKSSRLKKLAIDNFYKRATKYFERFVEEHSADVELLDQDIDNIFAVLDWCMQKAQRPEILNITKNITWFLGIRGMTTERYDYGLAGAEAARAIGKEEESLWIKAFDIGWVLINRGLYEEATSLYNDILSITEKKGYKKVTAICYRNLALMMRRQPQEKRSETASKAIIEEARVLTQKSLDIWIELGDQRGIAIATSTLGTIAMQLEQYDEAKTYYEKTLSVEQAQKNLEGIALAKSNLGRIAIKKGDYAEALRLIDEALDIDRKLNRLPGIAAGTHRKAHIYDREQNYSKALELLEEASEIYRKMGSISSLNQAQQEIQMLRDKIAGKTLGNLF